MTLRIANSGNSNAKDKWQIKKVDQDTVAKAIIWLSMMKRLTEKSSLLTMINSILNTKTANLSHETDYQIK